MGNILAASPLVAIANLLLENTVFPLVFAMWWFNRRGLESWKAVAYLWAYTLMIRLGAQVDNPLNLYIGQDLADAQLIYLTIYTALGIGYAVLGSGWALFLDNCDLLPVAARFPSAMQGQRRKVTYKMGDAYYENDTSPSAQEQSQDYDNLNRWGLPASLKPSWTHFFVTILAFLAAVAAPQVVYSWYMGVTGDELMAWLIDLLVPPAIYALYLGYSWGWGDVYVWGPNEAYLTSRKNNFGLSSEQIEKIVSETHARIATTLGPLAALHFLGVLVLGGVRMVSDDVDTNWLAACGLWGGLAIVLIVTAIVVQGRRARRDKQARLSRRDKQPKGGCEDAADDYYQKPQETVVSMETQRRAQTQLQLQPVVLTYL